VVIMSNSLSAQPELRMTVLPGESTDESRRGARSSAATRHLTAAPAETESDPGEKRSGDEQTGPDAGRYANAGPDCYWPEAG
jgi:hypothetical protein